MTKIRYSLFILIVMPTMAVCSKAVQLLTYNETSEKFQLHNDALVLISDLKQPVLVVSGVGDARIGKSTSLNFVRSHWRNPDSKLFDEVFPTNDSFERCTQGIWISVLKLNHGSLVLMDVEGTDLGNDAVTDHLSIFTALMSSGMVVFVRDTVTNHVNDFLYRVSRLSELIFDKKELTVKNFPRLRVALRTQLNPPSRKSLKDFVVKALIRPVHKDGLDKNREIIATHFPEEHIEASLVPFVSDKKAFTDYESLEKIGYVEGMLKLTKELKMFPWKRTLSGSLMDGFHLNLLATKLADAMNKNSWLEFGNVYLNVEKHVCAGSFEKHLKPLLNETADVIDHEKQERLKVFDEGCALEDFRNHTRTKLQKIIADKRKFENLQKELKEVETNLQKAQQELSTLKEKHDQEMSKKEREIDKEKQTSKELVQELERMRNENAKVINTIRDLKSQVEQLRRALKNAKKRGGGILDFVSRAVATGLALTPFMPSDVRLKQNITSLASSEFLCLGLHTYAWIWRGSATQLGLTGPGRGLIAQEVEFHYPEAVKMGPGGFKYVNYGLLMDYRKSLCD